jgi:hypothetical protein
MNELLFIALEVSRAVPIRYTLIDGFSHFVTLMTAPMLPAGKLAGGFAATGKRRHFCKWHGNVGTANEISSWLASSLDADVSKFGADTQPIDLPPLDMLAGAAFSSIIAGVAALFRFAATFRNVNGTLISG